MGKQIKIAINGFGRIGRALLRILQSYPNIEVVAINDVTDTKTLAHLFKYDSVHGKYKGTVTFNTDTLIVNGKNIQITNEKIPANLPWRNLNIDIVIECTGKFLDYDSAFKHIEAGAKKVILSAPPTDKKIKAICLGINDQILTVDDLIVSNASCTTNSAAPMIKVLNEMWGVSEAYITTVHSYTGDQRLHDAPHKDLRRGRAAALSIIPTSTGAAKAITKIFPELEGKIGGCGMRVPVPDGSLTDITCVLKKKPTVEEINKAFKDASETYLKGIIEYTEDPIVSIDIVGNSHSCIFDAEFTSIVGNMVKVLGWYDNEIGYSNRLAELIVKTAEIK
jgi:glyceraldehyde 3-phosphate dehydrogenase